MNLFSHATFFTTVAQLSGLPATHIPEIAFAGRSNAGKSSAINTLVGCRQLARTSKTPGRTQHINFFQIRQGGFFVDLPGYGYARVPAAQRETWDQLVGGYLRERQQLVGLVVIMDSRRPLQPLDDYLIQWFLPRQRPLHILLSKADKLTFQEQTNVLRNVSHAIKKYNMVCSVQLFSALKKIGIEECEEVFRRWFVMA